MIMERERQEVAKYGVSLLGKKLTLGSGGNLSVFNRELSLMAISPSGMEYQDIEAQDVVVMDLSGNIVDGKRKPSSEYQIHRILYENRMDMYAVIHAHTIFSTIFACLGEELLPATYMLASAGKKIKCAEYATFGTGELAVNAYKAMQGNNAALLANHGVVTGAESLKKALDILEQVEYSAELYYRARCIGNPKIIADDEMEKVIEKFKDYGQK